jgi:transglutaminase-like putative cysteine protease
VNTYLVYRASFYLMLFVATMSLSGDSPEGRFAGILGLIVAAVGAVAFFMVDRAGRWTMPRRMANLLALGSIAILYFEFSLDPNQRIPALSHWLVCLQLIKYFLPKTAEDDWFLFLLGLMQVLIGSVVNQTDEIGAWLFLWAMLAIWVLGQFFLQREAQRCAPVPRRSGSRRPQTAAVDPYRGLFTLPYVAATARVMVATLALGGLIFLVLPREAGAVRSQQGSTMAKHLTGFDEEVQLGQLGEILENDSVVMTVELTDKDNQPVHPSDEILWRGVTMIKYEGGKWHRQNRGTQSVVSFKPDKRIKEGPVLHQRIKLEPIDSPALFGIRPILAASSSQDNPPSLTSNDGTLFRPDEVIGEYDYDVISDVAPDRSQPYESRPSEHDKWLTSMPRELLPKLRAIAEPIVAGIPATGHAGIEARARKLAAFLRDSGDYTYTLQMSVVDSTLDPVEDFLVNRKAGHCEYFASALALLLRSVGIQTRVINGFKGGDWNELTQTLNVRQKHAHSWVEAYIGLDAQRDPIWLTLDATPAAERQKSIAQVGGLAGNFRPFTDSLRHFWVFYVIGYDGDRQDRLVYGPMRTIAHEVQEYYLKMGAWLRKWLARLFNFQTINEFFSLRGFVVSFVTLALAVGLAYLLFRIGRKVVLWLRGPVSDAASLSPGTFFYWRLNQILAAHDLERGASETQREFAERAQESLLRRGQLTEAVAGIPRQVALAFYQVRFGHRELDVDGLAQLNARLDELEASLKTP